MTDKPESTNSLRAALLREETPDKSEYERYRMNLELEINRVERLERATFHVCWISMLLAGGLTFVGGTKLFGSFDPYDDTANPLSISLAVIYVISAIIFSLSLASYYSRFRPRTRALKQENSDAKIEQLQQEIEELRKQLRG